VDPGDHSPDASETIPVVLTTVDEVSQILLLMNGIAGLLARHINATGLRLRGAMFLRIKDVDLTVAREAGAGIVWHCLFPGCYRTH
jgi:hypothetical protein